MDGFYPDWHCRGCKSDRRQQDQGTLNGSHSCRIVFPRAICPIVIMLIRDELHHSGPGFFRGFSFFLKNFPNLFFKWSLRAQ
jgi:hypothetical protein